MELVIITLVSLLIYPPAALIVLKLTKSYPTFRKKIVYTSLAITGVTLLAVTTKIYTRWQSVDFFLFMSMYFTFSLLVILLFQQEQLLLKIIAGIAMFIVFGIGYLSSTIGILGVGFVVGDLQATRSIYLTDNLIYKQYAQGNAISDYRKTEVTVCKILPVLSFLQRQIYSKTYDVAFKQHGANLSNIHPNEILGYNFKVSYDERKHQLLLNDSLRIYKLQITP